MKKIKVKVPAKINLSLDVLGKSEGFHQLSSIVCSVGIYDQIILKKRKDTKITLKEKGIKSGCEKTQNNAYKTAKLYLEKFNQSGVDIILKKRIPVGGGLGGSSADIAGVLLGLNALFDKKEDLYPLASALGSDVNFMLSGGLAIIEGKGDFIKRLKYPLPLYLIILTEKTSVSAKECYKIFDEQEKKYPPCTEQAVKFLKDENLSGFVKVIKNDLTCASTKIFPKILDNIASLEKTGAIKSIMTGSGSAVVGIFTSKKERDCAYKKLDKKQKKTAIKTKTIY